MTIDSTSAPAAHQFRMTNRRAFLAAAPALAVLTAGPAAALALPTGAVAVDPGLQHAIAAWREALHQNKHFSTTVVTPIRERWLALCEAIPHSVTRPLPDGTDGISTESEAHVGLARALLGERVYDGSADNAYAELVRLADQRDAQVKDLRKSTGLDAALKRSDEMGDIAEAALTVVENYPVRSLADLITKLEISEGERFTEVPLDLLLDDLRRIAEVSA